MRSEVSVRVPLAACAILLAASMASTALAQAAPASAPAASAVDVEIAQLKQKLAASPADTAAVRRLAELRRQQQATRLWALQSLCAGLKAYLAGDLAVAAPELKKAAQCPEVAALAKANLPVGLEDLAKPPGTAKPGPATTKPAVCDGCFGLGNQDCGSCNGTGLANCSACKGRPPRTGYSSCFTCNGRGIESCSTCQGSGEVPCKKCGGNVPAAPVAAPSAPPAVDPLKKAAARLLAIATYLSSGGIDLGATGLSPVAAQAAASGSPSPAAPPAPSPATPGN